DYYCAICHSSAHAFF
nr:immunoglobulin light chain junction region [Macaca mulatta]